MALTLSPFAAHRPLDGSFSTGQDQIGTGCTQLLLIGASLLAAEQKMRWRHRETDPMSIGAFGLGVENRLNIGNRVTEVSDDTPTAMGQKAVAELNKTCGVRLVRGIAHGDQRGIGQSQSLLQHEPCGWRFRATNEPPTPTVLIQRGKKVPLHEQGFISDEPGPCAWIAVGITAEIKIAEDINQVLLDRKGCAMPAQQLETCVPVVVPTSFALEGVDARWRRQPVAVVLHGCLEGSAITARHITDHPVDVEQQKLASGWVPVQGERFWRLVG